MSCILGVAMFTVLLKLAYKKNCLDSDERFDDK